MPKKQALTLLEVVIVITLFALLIGVIIQSYVTISQVTLKLEREKEVGKEYLLFSQILENISEEATIDYSQYGDSLLQSNGVTNILYLTGGKWSGTQIFSSGNCQSMNNFLRDFNTNNTNDTDHCKLILQQNQNNGTENIIDLIPNTKILQSSMLFRIIPYMSNQALLNTFGELQMGQPGFWIFGSLAGKFFQPQKWTTNTMLPLQIFYTLQGPVDNIYAIKVDTNEN